MRRVQAIVESLLRAPTGLAGARIVLPARFLPVPGQAFLALVPEAQQPVRLPLYPFHIGTDSFLAELPTETGWRPGQPLDLLGPIGKGFALPPQASRWLLIALGTSTGPLLPLIPAGSAAGAAISLWSDPWPVDLPPEVERAQSLDDALTWADYVACSVDAGGLQALLSDTAETIRSAEVQIQWITPLPCGLGVCGTCAFRVGRRQLLACVDGPVFRAPRGVS